MSTLRERILSPPRSHREELLRFFAVGGTGYVLALAMYAGEIELGMSPYLAVPAVFVLNGLFNFTLNRYWSFPRSGRPVSEELGRFAIVALGSLCVNYLALFILHDLIGMAPVPAQALAVLIAAPAGFLGQKLFSFRPVRSE